MPVKTYTFPTFPITGQLFHVPGAGYDGGLTSGGAQFITPEPGGFGILEIEPSTIDTEWINPAASWLMSKINGEVFRVRLAPFPQVAYSKTRKNWLSCEWLNEDADPDLDATMSFDSAALKGATGVTIETEPFGRLLRAGHVIGHEFECYLIDEITYEGSIATVTVKPPLRRDIDDGDDCLLRPWFTGRIANGAEFRASYRAETVGHIKLGNIILHEAVVDPEPEPGP